MATVSSPVRDFLQIAAGTSTLASEDTTRSVKARTTADPASKAYSLTSDELSQKTVSFGPLIRSLLAGVRCQLRLLQHEVHRRSGALSLSDVSP